MANLSFYNGYKNVYSQVFFTTVTTLYSYWQGEGGSLYIVYYNVQVKPKST